MDSLARWFLKTGSVLLLIGALLKGTKRMSWAGRIPGDTTWQLGKRPVRLPLGTGAVLLLLLTIYLNTAGRRR